jgi:trans-2,3-dihydro-3-hydroxyanthranilate isomerase
MEPELMQSLAAELNLSETAFVLPPADPASTRRVRIFNRTAEMNFAGHPVLGTACVLAGRGLANDDRMVLEVPAGPVGIEILRDSEGAVRGGTIEAPQPLTLGDEVPVADVAACLGLRPEDVVTASHRPVVATMGNAYVIAELAPEALARCQPDVAAFRRARAARGGPESRFSLHVYVRHGAKIRTRMFAPLAGTWEDPATGSANAPLGALLLSLDGGDRLRIEIEQGIEMGRPSLLRVDARRTPEGFRATLSGSCVPVFTGAYRHDPS